MAKTISGLIMASNGNVYFYDQRLGWLEIHLKWNLNLLRKIKMKKNEFYLP